MENVKQVRKPKFTSRLARTLGLSLLAVLATAAMTATSASASLPEWGGCEPLAGGKYHDSACVQPLTSAARKTQGHYEWYTGERFGKVFEEQYEFEPKQLDHYSIGELEPPGSEIGPSTFETSAGKKMQCASGSIRFQLENANTKGVKQVFLALRGCESDGKHCYSNNTVPAAGEVTNEQEWFAEEGLKGTLGYISGKGAGSPEVGLLLTTFRTPTQWKEKNEAEGLKKGEYSTAERLLLANCEGGIGTLWIGGEKNGGNAIISLIKPVDQMTSEFEQSYTQSAGVQSPSAFEGRKTTGLMGFSESTWRPLGFETAFVDHAEGGAPPIEIKATP